MFKVKELYSYFSSLIIFLLSVFLLTSQINYTYILLSITLFTFVFFSNVLDEELSIFYKNEQPILIKTIKYVAKFLILFPISFVIPIYLYILILQNKFILFSLVVIIPVVMSLVLFLNFIILKIKNKKSRDDAQDEEDLKDNSFIIYKLNKRNFFIINLLSAIIFVVVVDYVNYFFNKPFSIDLNSFYFTSSYISKNIFEFLYKLNEFNLFSKGLLIDIVGNFVISVILVYLFISSLFFINPNFYGSKLLEKDKNSISYNNKFKVIINNYKFIIIIYVLFISSFLLVLTMMTGNKEDKDIKDEEYVLNNSLKFMKEGKPSYIDCGFSHDNLEAPMALEIENNLSSINNDIFKKINNEMTNISNFSKDKNLKIKNELLENINSKVSYLDEYVLSCLGYNIQYRENIYNLVDGIFSNDIDIAKNIQSLIKNNKVFQEVNSEIENKIKENLPFAVNVTLWVKDKFGKNKEEQNSNDFKDIKVIRESILTDYNKKINEDINYILKKKFNITQEDLNIFQIVKKQKESDINIYAEINNKEDYDAYIFELNKDKEKQKEYINKVDTFFKTLRSLKKANKIYENYLTNYNNENVFIEYGLLDNKNSIESLNYLSDEFNLHFLENSKSNNVNLSKNNTFEIYLRELYSRLFKKMNSLNNGNSKKGFGLKIDNLELIQTTIEDFSVEVKESLKSNFLVWNNIKNNGLKDYNDSKNKNEQDKINNKPIGFDNETLTNIKNYRDSKNKEKVVMKDSDVELIQSKIRDIYNKLKNRKKITMDFNENSIATYKNYIRVNIQEIKEVYRKYNLDTNLIDRYVDNFFKELIVSKNTVLSNSKSTDNFNLFINYFLKTEFDKASDIISTNHTQPSNRYYGVNDEEYIVDSIEENSKNEDNTSMDNKTKDYTNNNTVENVTPDNESLDNNSIENMAKLLELGSNENMEDNKRSTSLIKDNVSR